MIKIVKVKDNSIMYSCSCGVQGKCIFKSLVVNSQKIIRITCPNCGTTENVFLSKDTDVLADEETVYSFALVVNNKIIGD